MRVNHADWPCNTVRTASVISTSEEKGKASLGLSPPSSHRATGNREKIAEAHYFIDLVYSQRLPMVIRQQQ